MREWWRGPGAAAAERDGAMLLAYRLQAVSVGLASTAAAVLTLLIFLLLPGHGAVAVRPFLALVACAAGGGVVVALLPWPRLLAHPIGGWLFYVWSVADIVLISWAVGVTGWNRSDLYIFYSLTTLFFAASYPPRGQAFLLLFTFACYGGTLALHGFHVGIATFVLRLATIGVGAGMASFLSRQLMRQMTAHAAAKHDAERRARILANVAASAREMISLDPLQLLGTVLDAVVAQEFEIAALWSCADGDGTGGVTQLRADRAWAFDTTGPLLQRVVQNARACGGAVAATDEELADQPPTGADPLACLLAVPVWSDGLVAAVLVAADRRRRADAAQIEAVELLAAQTGRALETIAFTERLRRSEDRFRALVQNAADVVLVLDAQGRIQYASPAIANITGRDPDEVLGVDALTLVHPDDRPAVATQFGGVAERPGASDRLELRAQHRDGGWRWVDVMVTNLLGLPGVEGLVANLHDISALRQQAFHDALTGLPNRAAFQQHLDRALAGRAVRGGEVGVLFVDLDRFKVVNDSLGHGLGDALLRQFAVRLRDCVGEQALVARLGGDEFTIVVDGLSDAEEALTLGRRVIAACEAPAAIAGRELFLSASVGVAISGAATLDADDLLRQSDVALYRAKDSGGGRVELFDARLGDETLARLELEADLRRALHEHEFRVFYQPQVDLRTGDLVGMEALVRWQHPTRGLLAPGAFIGIAEESGLIVPLGRWVLEEACHQFQAWRRAGALADTVHISVNVSPLQFRHGSFVEEVAATLQETALPGRCLTLEITESMLVEDADAALASLTALKAMGVALAIDDFGTGYSSLGYLRRYPIDELKLDRSFVSGIDADEDAAALVQGIIALGHTLRLTLVAEGVETAGEMRVLEEFGCEVGQGYRFARPLSADATEQALHSGHSYAAAIVPDAA